MFKDDGFLGTGATFGADLNLLLFVLLLVPLMLVGFRYARRKQFKNHKAIMTTVTLCNWVLVLLIMAVSYNDNVRPGVPDHLGDSFFLSPTLHVLVALSAQLLATYLVIRMWFEKSLPAGLLVKNFKPWMRLTLGLWLVTATLGIITYGVWYLDNDEEAAAPSASSDGLKQEVPLQGFAFNPKELTVAVGTTVTWVNKESAPHTVTFDDGSAGSGQLLQGDTFSHTFDQVGSYPIHCELHGAAGGKGMSMTVTVVESLENAAPAPAPAATEPAAAATEAMEMATPEAPAATEAAPAEGDVAVDLQNYEFKPNAITIPAGTTVTWTNKDFDGHTVTSDDGSIDSGNLDTDATYSYTFDTPGTYPLYCKYHGNPGGLGMHMTVTVTE